MDAIQGYKTKSEEMPFWNDADYASLVAINLASFESPVQLTQAELDMVFETEEIIDHLRTEGS